MAEQIERTERLLNLVMCLMASAQPVPRAAIRGSIPGYGSAASDSAFERMFERDKDELRSMGIPVETVTDTGGEVLGYRIPRESYVLAGIDLTLAERAAVTVAGQVWGQAVVAPLAGTALRKLESISADGWTPADVRGSIALTASDGALIPLMAALRQDRVVRFDYRTPDADEAARRTVSPWGLRSTRGAWFLVGRDHDRDAVRTYRLSRMVGTVTVTGTPRPHQPPEGFDVRQPTPDTESVRARVRLAPGRAASLRRISVSEDPWSAGEVVVEGGSFDQLASLVCACGPDAVVIEPAELVTRVRAALGAIARGHRHGDESR